MPRDDARIPDNRGGQPIDLPVVAGGPAAYFATLPIKAAVAALRDAGLPAIVSNSAGTFVCNHVFYGLMHLATTRGFDFCGGFLHVPFLPSQAALQDVAIYKDPPRLKQTMADLDEAKAKLPELYEHWEEAAELNG